MKTAMRSLAMLMLLYLLSALSLHAQDDGANEARSLYRQALELTLAQRDSAAPETVGAEAAPTEQSLGGVVVPPQARELFAASAQDFEAAASRVEGGAGGGAAGAALRYNAANAWVLAAKPERAILNLRAYLLHDPGNARAWENLAQARLAASTLPLGSDTVGSLPLAYLLPLAGLIALNLALLGAGLWALLRKKALLVVSLLLLLPGSAAFIAFGLVQHQAQSLVVFAKETQARKGDAELYTALPEQPYKAGQEAWLIQEREGWALLQVGEVQSWVPVASFVRVSELAGGSSRAFLPMP